MADYCTAVDVQVYLANFVLDATSQPTLTQVEQMCTDVSDNLIDPIIRRIISLPVTDAQGLLYLQQWSTNCVLASIYRAIESEPNVSIIYDDKCTEFKQAFMDDPGLVVTPTPGASDTPRGGGSTRPDPVWVKNEQQW